MPGGHRSWCFTYNNPPSGVSQDVFQSEDGTPHYAGQQTPEALSGLRHYVLCNINPEWWSNWWRQSDLTDQVKFIIYSYEIGAQGTPHLQGYVVMRSSTGIGPVKRILGNAVHLEPTRGTPEENIAYCSKLDDTHLYGPFEWGVRPRPGKRSDLDDLCDMVKSGASDLQIATDHPAGYARYANHISKYRLAVHIPKQRDVLGIVLWGATGTGKTHWVYNNWPMDQIFRVSWNPAGVCWFDGYQLEPVLLFDDFYACIPLDQMLHMLDKWPLRVQVKGGFTIAAWTTVVITSNQDPDLWYSYQSMGTQTASPEKLQALKRRLPVVLEVQSRSDLEHFAIPPPILAPPP